MKTLLHPFIAAALLLSSAVLASADTVLSPIKRQEALARGKELVAVRDVVPVTTNPFFPAAFAEAVSSVGRVSGPVAPAAGEAAPAGPRTERDLLQAIASSLKPSGYIVLGGEPSLSFGQKRVKAGGILTITFEGKQYTLEVTSIDRTNFTLRLNREEFTRTIK
jgi:hypothetical protein